MPDPVPALLKKPRKPRGPISADTLASLRLAETVAASAVSPDFEAGFVRQQVAPKFRTDYGKLVATARRTAARAIERSADKRKATRLEANAQKALLTVIREIQKQAKRKHEAANPEMLANYAVGQELDTLPKIVQAAINIHSRLVPDVEAGDAAPDDVLPTIDAAKIKELEDRYADYTGEDLRQARAQGGATG